MATKTATAPQFFTRQFKRIHNQIELIHVKVNKEIGLWIFTKYVYTAEQLSTEHAKIKSLADQIGFHATTWNQNGALSDAGLEGYNTKRDEIDDLLHKLNLAIQSRKPQWWERASAALESFVQLVCDAVPRLVKAKIGLLGSIKQAFLGGPSDSEQLPLLTNGLDDY